MGYLDVGGRNEDMHHSHVGIKASLCILFHNAREAADLGPEALSGNLPDAVKLALGGYGKSCLDNVYTKFIKLPGDLELFVLGERYARGLLAIPESGVKNADFFINKRMNVVEDDSPQRFRMS